MRPTCSIDFHNYLHHYPQVADQRKHFKKVKIKIPSTTGFTLEIPEFQWVYHLHFIGISNRPNPLIQKQ